MLFCFFFLALGARIAQYAGMHLHKFVTKRPEYKENKISDALQLVILRCTSITKFYFYFQVFFLRVLWTWIQLWPKMIC